MYEGDTEGGSPAGLARALASSEARVDCSGPRRGSSGRVWRVPCIVEWPAGPARVRAGVARARDLREALGLVEARVDLGLDKLVVIVESGLEEVEDLGVLGVTLVPGSLAAGAPRAAREEYYVKPVVGGAEVERLARRYEGRLLKRGRYVGHALVYLPLYSVDAVLHRIEAGEASQLESARLTLDFELIHGSLVAFAGDEGIEVYGEWQRLGDLDLEAVEILEIIAREGAASLSELKAHIGEADVEDYIEVLLELGLIDEVERGLFILRPPRLEGYRSVYAAAREAGLLEAGPPAGGQRLPGEAPVSTLRALVSIYGRIEAERSLYYPLYLVEYEKGRGDQRVYTYVVIDGVSGWRAEDVEDLIVTSERVMEALDEVMWRT